MTPSIGWCKLMFGFISTQKDCTGVDDVPNNDYDPHAEIIRIHFQSTCHTALDACREDPSCASSIQPVLMYCDLHRCNRNACMDALQSFYRTSHEDLSLDIAFCLCKKTSNRHDVCMIAQEKLHPVCAQRPPDIINPQTSNGAIYQPPPACHIIADLCKEDEECRFRLERYEQSCAVDSVTKKCAGRTNSCRSAMLGILGTPLRTTCTCQGTDVQQMYECLGWHRLLWLNPCVVESQKDFHMKRLAELGFLITTIITTTTTTTTTPMPHRTHPSPVEFHRPHLTLSTTTESSYISNHIEQSTDSMPESLLANRNNHNDSTIVNVGNSINGGGSNGKQYLVLYTKTSTAETGAAATTHPTAIRVTTESTTTTVPTTTEITTTTTEASTRPPTRYCVVQRPQQSDQLIPESTTRRIYSLDDAECSELCSCGDTVTLTCHALCVPFTPCRTALAFYSHASPAYQAFRGRCLCYSGRFICMRPPPGDYSLPGGIFLLLGYSTTDEALLRPYTNLGVQDSIRGLQQYVNKHIENQTSCTLTLFNMTDENIIISARLPHDTRISPLELLKKEKVQCTHILEKISHHVNTQHNELAAHRLLSIFKMAEVQFVSPDTSDSTKRHSANYCLLFFSVLTYTFFPVVRWLCPYLLCFPQRTRHY